VFVLCTTPEMWKSLCEAVGRPELVDDERFSNARARAHNIEPLAAIVGEWTRQRSKHDVMKILGEAGVPCGKVLDSVELLNDPHLKERGMVVTVNHPVRGSFTMPGCPVRLEDSPVEVRAAPLLGQHNGEVYGEWLGLTAADLERLRTGGVL
jgi:formyl-CoA transferase